MAASSKQLKEQFVTGLTGGSTVDIYLTTSVSIIAYLAWSILKKRTSLFDNDTQNFAKILDFFVNWVALLLSVTQYSENVILLILGITFPMFIALNNKSKYEAPRSQRINIQYLSSKEFIPFKPYITVYRSQMMVITCICILAVDFPIFPRRFAKVETWGTSLMDLGVGSFVFSMGLVSARQLIKQRFDNRYSYARSAISSLKNSIPILILGIIRLASVKSLDYQEHMTEYGKHWNFFFTLSFVPLIANLIFPLIDFITPLVCSSMIIIIYEIALTKFGLLEYILKTERPNLLAMNKEGIFSSIGYLAIYLNGLSLGYVILPLFPTHRNLFKMSDSKDLIIETITKRSVFTVSPTKGLLILSVCFHVLYYVIDTCYYYGVSRRMANGLYVIWVSAYNCTYLLGYALVEKFIWGEPHYEFTNENRKAPNSLNIWYKNSVPESLSAVNFNSLVLFLIANLLTGLVNLTIDTINAKNQTALLVLVLYAGALALVAHTLYAKKIHLR